MIAIRTLLTLTLLLGVGYPLAVTGLAQLFVPWQANGSQLTDAKQQQQAREYERDNRKHISHSGLLRNFRIHGEPRRSRVAPPTSNAGR